MKVVLMTDGNRGIGSYCLNLNNYLTKKEHEVLFVSIAPWRKQPIQNLYQPKSIFLFHVLGWVFNLKKMVKDIDAFGADIIHFHWPTGQTDLALKHLIKLNTPVMATIHVAINSKNHWVDKIWRWWYGFVRKPMSKVMAINSISTFVKKQLLERQDVTNVETTLIYAGIDTDIFKPYNTGDNGDTLELIFVGQIMHEKGVDHLVEAVMNISKKRKVRLRLIGDGNLKEHLMHKTEGHPEVEWIGFLSGQKAVAELYASGDATILPTRWDEAFSMVPLESMSCGTPVIATARGGSPEQITEGKTGYFLEGDEVVDIENKLLNLDLKKLRNMKKACRDHILKNHSLDVMGEKHVELYEKLIKEYKSQ